MRKLARFIVMWLIAVALPFQGVAAATMLHCGSANPAPAASAHEGHAHHHHGADSTASSAGTPSHHHGDHHGATADSTSTPPLSHHQADGKASCSACASCCSALALPTTPVIVATHTVADTITTLRLLPVVAFLTGGPERPPRTIHV
jgi:hypothetical protein